MKKLLSFLMLAGVCLNAELTLMQKVADERKPIIQPIQQEQPPEGAKEEVYIDESPELSPTVQESMLGMILFQRPLTNPIWPSTKPQAFERVERLDDWGAQGQYVTINFAVYPLKELKNLRIQVLHSSIKPEIRLVRYWNIIYPNYNSYKNASSPKYYRRMPEFLMPVTACDAPVKEPQRFFLTFKLPKDGTTSVKGVIAVSHDGFNQAVRLPFSIRVLPFELKQDPKKNYTSYYYQVRHGQNKFFKNHKDDKKLVHDVQVNEFKRMLEYGFTRPPVFQMTYGTLPDGTKDAYYIPYLDEFMAELKEAGFDNKHEIPVTGCSGGWLYEKLTGLKLNRFHMDTIECDKIPQKLYDTMDSALVKFLNYAKAHDYPAIIFNPIDEPSAASLPFVLEIYKIFKKHGLKTFQTSPPSNFIAQGDKLFDIYNYGAFNVPYEKATSGDKLEYWCYPNDNTYQIKDPYVMCHGGRMTYGLGYWRSGFHCIIPWIWRSNTHNRIGNSGGNLLWPDDGQLYMTTYWECFRLGVDDMRYIYTLEDAIVRRENSRDPNVQEIIREAKKLLQEVWNTVCPQPAYLRDNLLPHAELEAIRAQLAMMLLRLKATAETQDKVAPSVIIDPKGKYEWPKESLDNENIISIPLKKWKPICKELTLEETESRLDVKIGVDHLLVGEGYAGNVQYPQGWPRIKYEFKGEERDFTKFSHVIFDITVSSDRDAQSDYSWPVSIGFYTSKREEYEFRFANTLEPNVKHRIAIPLEKLGTFSRESKKDMRSMQFYIGENNYPHGCHLNLVFENVCLRGYTKPTLLRVDIPKKVALPLTGFAVSALVGGVENDAFCTVSMDLCDANGILQSSATPIVNDHAVCGFTGKGLKAGAYKVRAKAVAKDGTVFSEAVLPLNIINGPAAR